MMDGLFTKNTNPNQSLRLKWWERRCFKHQDGMGWEPLIRTRRSPWMRLNERQREKERTQFIREQRAFKAREVTFLYKWK